MNTKTRPTPSIQKIRRLAAGGKRAAGWRLQRQNRRIRRPDPGRVHYGAGDPSLTSVAGLVPFGRHLRKIGLDDELARAFGHLKQGPFVVYPMPSQMRTIIDANAVGEPRIFGLENLAADPLFAMLAGGNVASIDTHYRDLGRFDALEIFCLEAIMTKYGLTRSRIRGHEVVHLDIDTTVEPLFGSQQGAKPGHNPRYHGRASYHPILSAIAETKTCVGACLRPGDTGLGDEDAEIVSTHVRRVKRELGDEQTLRVRIDAGGDCTALMGAIEDEGALFTIKARLTQDLKLAIYHTKNWQTVERDVDGKPLRQVANVSFERQAWRDGQRKVRVVAIRTREEVSGKQVYLWPELDYTAKAYLTNDFGGDGESISREYEDRAEVETMIREWKYDLGIGAVPTGEFDANHVMLLMKLLTHNLVRDFVASCMPSLLNWRLAWLRRVLFLVPGRLLQTGNRRYLRLPARSPLYQLRC